jgi:hypothetical protein
LRRVLIGSRCVADNDLITEQADCLVIQDAHGFANAQPGFASHEQRTTDIPKDHRRHGHHKTFGSAQIVGHRNFLLSASAGRKFFKNSMKVKIPDELKADVPHSKWGKMLTATPIVMTVLATMLAGLSSSEMTRAQYDRSLAAQQQSKAGDQWSFFQAKRLRGAMQRSTLDLLQSTTEVRPLNSQTVIQSAGGELAPEVAAALEKGDLPAAPVTSAMDADVKAALEALEGSRPESEIAALLVKVKVQTLAESLRAATDAAMAYDAATKPANQTIEKIEKSLAATSDKSLSRDFIAARLHYTALRYDAEARLNQAVAYVYELQVRKSNVSAERHHARSQRFFYGMLAAQMAVIIATFAIAARQRNLLWSIAAAAGLAAIILAVYVYLFV